MNSQTSSFLWSVATALIIVRTTYWLLRTPPGESPKAIQDLHIYGVRNRVRFAGFGVAGLFVVFTFVFRRDLSQSGDRWLVTIPIGFILLGIWLATGTVITNTRGITKKTLWASRTIAWVDISGVRFYERQKYVEVRTARQKISIDLRFVALRRLLDEILAHTKAQLERK
jgi:hypothetical protein